MGFAHIRALTVAAVVLAFALPAAAHEIGTTQVDVVFHRDHTYSIDVIVAPQSTLNKLERVAAQPRSQNLTAVQLTEHLQALAPRFLEAADVRFGADRVSSRLEISPVTATNDAARPSFVVFRLSGDIPAKATSFTWRYALAYGAYALTIANEGHGEKSRVWLDADATSVSFPLASDIIPPSRLDIIRQYLILGFTHILPKGLDHILFVLGMFLLTARVRDVLAQVTAFTIAHSITLGLTMYGAVSVSPRIVEPAIALSIAYIAIENVVTTKLKPWRVGIVFCFGLLHGMGFAGVLKELGLPRSQFVPALVSFNVGVEAGQLTVIATAFLLFAYWWQGKPWYRQRFVVPASVAIGAIGLFWTVQRVMS